MVGLDQNGKLTQQLVDINQGTSQLIAKAFAVANQSVSTFSQTDTNLYFLRYNLLNEYYKAVTQSADLYTQNLIDLSSDDKYPITLTLRSVLLIFLVISAVFSFLALVCITPIFNLVNRNQEEVIKLFLEIPLPKVKQLFTKCEAFSNSLQIGEEEEA
jgi:hypothetical protein